MSSRRLSDTGQRLFGWPLVNDLTVEMAAGRGRSVLQAVESEVVGGRVDDLVLWVSQRAGDGIVRTVRTIEKWSATCVGPQTSRSCMAWMVAPFRLLVAMALVVSGSMTSSVRVKRAVVASVSRVWRRPTRAETHPE